MKKMKIGLIDVDGHNYPNLPLMKLSSWHKGRGDQVEWYDWAKGFCEPYDIVYMSKVFTFTDDYQNPIYAKSIFRGGTGYHYPDGGKELPYEIEHIYPDYDLYGITDTAYGFLTRGCPRGCDFCIVKDKEGRKSVKVADLSEFWINQKHIELLDPNMLACKDWEQLMIQLLKSNAKINFSQGLDIRLMTEAKQEYIEQLKLDAIHFAWDRWEEKDLIIPKFESFRKRSKINSRKLQVYVLVGDREPRILESDLYRINWLKDNGFTPYVMIYDKDKLPRGHELKKLQRWVNNRFVFWKCSWDEYQKGNK